MPFSPPITVTLRSVTLVRADQDPALDDAADERLRVADHERPLDRAVQVHRRRPDRVRGAEPADDDRRDGDRGERAAAAELAAHLGVLEAQAREERVPEELCGDPADRVEPERPAERRHHPEPAHRAVDEPELERAERQREPQPGW